MKPDLKISSSFVLTSVFSFGLLMAPLVGHAQLGAGLGETEVQPAERLAKLGIKFRGKPVSADALPDLRYVTITTANGLKMQSADCKILGELSNLRSLNINNAVIKADCVRSLSAARSLQSLSLSRVFFEKGAIAELGTLASLNSLNIYGSWGVTPDELGSLKNLKLLRRLRLAQGINPGEGDPVSDAHVAALDGMVGLESLDVYNSRITDASAVVISRMTGLRRLDLTKARFTEKGIEALAANQRLRDLRLSRIETFGAGIGAALAKLQSVAELSLYGAHVKDGLAGLSGMTALRKLNLSNTGVTDADMAEVAKLPQLSILHAQANRRITDATLTALGNRKQLRTLRIGGSRVTDSGVAQLSKLTLLTEVDLADTVVTDRSVELLSSLPLQRVTLNRSQITDKGLRMLAEMQTMRYLSAYSTDTSKALGKQLKALRKGLSVYN